MVGANHHLGETRLAMATESNGRDKFDMRQAEETWSNFLKLSAWTAGLTIVLVILMGAFLTGSHNVLR
jgi:Bacterial aa3 type cytochrome c oxidase subunit IV